MKDTKTKSSASKFYPCGRPRPVAPPPLSKNRIDEYQRLLRNYLSDKKLKYSEQRWLMAKLILETGGHLDAQEMIERVRAKYPSIGAATIYRNIKVLCDARILEPSHQNIHGRDVFELIEDTHHDHILCVDCGEVFEFKSSKIELIQDGMAKSLSFRPISHRHVIHGRCEFLEEKQRQSRGERKD